MTMLRAVALLAAVAQAASATEARSVPRCFDRVRVIRAGDDRAYRLPEARDVTGGWAFYREEYNSDASCAQGDFNGDGVVDYVSIVLSTAGKGFGLAVFLSKPDGSYVRTLLIPDGGDLFTPQETRVSAIEPGTHKDFYGCSAVDKTQAIALKYSGVDYFARQDQWLRGLRTTDLQARHIVFYWNEETAQFRSKALCGAAP